MTLAIDGEVEPVALLRRSPCTTAVRLRSSVLLRPPRNIMLLRSPNVKTLGRRRTERVGFEPTRPLRAYRFSRAAGSTRLSHLSSVCVILEILLKACQVF